MPEPGFRVENSHYTMTSTGILHSHREGYLGAPLPINNPAARSPLANILSVGYNQIDPESGALASRVNLNLFSNGDESIITKRVISPSGELLFDENPDELLEEFKHLYPKYRELVSRLGLREGPEANLLHLRLAYWKIQEGVEFPPAVQDLAPVKDEIPQFAPVFAQWSRATEMKSLAEDYRWQLMPMTRADFPTEEDRAEQLHFKEEYQPPAIYPGYPQHSIASISTGPSLGKDPQVIAGEGILEGTHVAHNLQTTEIKEPESTSIIPALIPTDKLEELPQTDQPVGTELSRGTSTKATRRTRKYTPERKIMDRAKAVKADSIPIPTDSKPIGDILNAKSGEYGNIIRDEAGKPRLDNDGLLTIEFSQRGGFTVRIPPDLLGI